MFLFLYLINKKWINKSPSNNFVEFVVLQWFKYGAILGIVIFITVQLNIFDLLNTLFILALLIIIELIGIQNLKNPFIYLNLKIKTALIKRLKKIEFNQSLKSLFSIKKKELNNFNHFPLYFLFAFVIIITFLGRFYFLKYDLYLLSNSWNNDLEAMFNLDRQNWFFPNNNLLGELAYTNFYAKIFDVSPEIALQSMGVFEAILLSMLLFWLMRKCTSSEYFIPTITAISFATFLTIIPVNLNFLIQRNPIFLALTFAIPTFYFLLNPNELKLKQTPFFLSFTFAFVIIGLIDLFTFCVLVPPFVLVSIFLSNKSNNIRFFVAVASFLFSLVLLFGIYYTMCYNLEIDFIDFIHSNLISVASYTYFPQLIFPINSLIFYYVISTFLALIIILYRTLIFKENRKISAAFLVYFLCLIIVLKIDNIWIDKDLIVQSFTIFFPIVFGIVVGVVFELFNSFTIKNRKIQNFSTLISLVVIVYFSVTLQKNTILKFQLTDQKPLQVLSIYDQIHSDYFPFSFAVVDQNTSQILSENNHYFVNYSEFLDSYLLKDAKYFENYKNQNYLKKNPQVVLPNSILLFIYNNDNSEKLVYQMKILKQRGREIKLFYASSNLNVYEIINQPKSSKTSDLIF
jgi:hypothetical protein